MKNIALLGSTGSIGVTALRVIESAPNEYRVVALGAGKNTSLLSRQIERFRPLAVAVMDQASAQELESRLDGSYRPAVYHGQDGMSAIAAMGEADTVISAVSGAAGLVPTFAAIRAGKNLALANKETMVMAGPIVLKEAERCRAAILPIDSEHSAILQSLRGHLRQDLRKVVLTASGGPFRDYTLEQMASVTPEQALSHPVWEMGKKISIDSATLMNKGLEVIEAKWLFNLSVDQIEILIHPQGVVHSLVEYIDGSVIAQMGIPDMTIPIAYALAYPHHMQTGLPPLRLEERSPLTFFKPDLDRFKCLRLCLEAVEKGGSLPAVLNAANEVAVDSFLRGSIGFLEIPEVIQGTMVSHRCREIREIEDVLAADQWARIKAREIVEELSRGRDAASWPQRGEGLQ